MKFSYLVPCVIKKKKKRRNELESTHLLTSLFIPGDYQDTIICLLEIKNMNK